MSAAVSPSTRLLILLRSHVAAAVAWERRGLDRMLDVARRALGATPPSQDGMFDDLADELFARWPVEAQQRPASRPRDAIRWAKLHEAHQDDLPLAA